MNIDERIALITCNLVEVIGGDESMNKIRSILDERPLHILWRTQLVELPHLSDFSYLFKLSDFLHAGCRITILLDDLQAVLDNRQAVDNYEHVIKVLLKLIGVDDEQLTNLTFVRGSLIQLSPQYTMDIYKLSTRITSNSEMIRKGESSVLSGMLYPLFQVLDEEYLDVDAQFGTSDEKKVFKFAENALPALGYESRIHFTISSKMKSMTRIELSDSPEVVLKKFKSMFCKEGSIQDNDVLLFIKMVLFALPAYKKGFTIQRDLKHGESRLYASYSELEQAFLSKAIHPLDLKQNACRAVNELLQLVTSTM